MSRTVRKIKLWERKKRRAKYVRKPKGKLFEPVAEF